MSDTRLIERWLPIGAIGEESARERRSMTALPPTYYLHVWWARRPLVASRAAVLASLLPADTDQAKFLHVLGIHGDPVASKRRIEKATREGVRLGADAYGYARAFGYMPTAVERGFVSSEIAKAIGGGATVLDPTAGGGSIPFESARLGLNTVANDLNPVAVLIERATVEWPIAYGQLVHDEFVVIGQDLVKRVRSRLSDTFPQEPVPDTRPDGYLWARTIVCPYCSGVVPLSPNWRLAPGGTGLRLKPHLGNGPHDPSRHIEFEIVETVAKQSAATVADGDGMCPFTDCHRQIDGDEIKRQAHAGQMGQQLMAVIFKRRVETRTKSGKVGKDGWERGYRAPRPEDDNTQSIAKRMAEKLPEWEALDIIPREEIGEPSNYDRGHRMYGMNRWVDMYSPRQLLGHCTAVEVYRELLNEAQANGRLTDVRKPERVNDFETPRLRN